MHILISTTGELFLEDIENMKGFSIIDKSENSNLTNLLTISKPAEENHYWLDAEAVIALSSKAGDSNWLKDFWNMLAMVEKYGYSDMQNKRIKAHMEQKA